MPLSKHYKGKGAKVMRDMKKRYGDKAGERVFYATENKRKSSERERLSEAFSKRSKKRRKARGS